jgi:hypothetical protein
MNTKHLSIRSSLGLIAALLGVVTGCTAPIDEADEAPVGEAAQSITYGGTLVVVKEAKISSLFGAASDYEASGVQVLGSDLYVIFDNKDQIAKIPTSLTAGTAAYTPGTLSSSSKQYEAITLDTNGTTHFYVSQEVSPAKIVQLDGAGSAQGEEYQSTGVSFPDDDNKGFEGLAWVRRNSDDYLLALCEGNNCGANTGTSKPGMIKVLRQTGSSWTVDTSIQLCGTTSCTTGIFSDYSDIALFPLADGSYKVAITSQETKQLWIGTLSATSWTLSAGTRYDYPSSSYCNVEGVTFLTATRLALASDQYTGSSAGCFDEDESMHIVDIP